MVAFLAGLVVFLMLMLAGAWASIERKNERIAELEELLSPPRSVPREPTRAAPVAMAQRDTLPNLWEPERDEEQTLVSATQP